MLKLLIFKISLSETHISPKQFEDKFLVISVGNPLNPIIKICKSEIFPKISNL